MSRILSSKSSGGGVFVVRRAISADAPCLGGTPSILPPGRCRSRYRPAPDSSWCQAVLPLQLGEVLFPVLVFCSALAGLVLPQLDPADLAGDRLGQLAELQPAHPLVGRQPAAAVREDRQRRVPARLVAGREH